MEATRVAPATDVCLVGLGAAGSMAAYALVRAGREVLALEAGPPRGSHDIVMDELLSTNFRNVWGVTKFNQEVPTWRANANSPRKPTKHTQRIENGIGGNSLAYGAISLRFHPDDFRVRSSTLARYGPAALPPGSDVADWPLSYADLEPYYDAAERILGVSGQAGNVRGEIQPDGNPFEGPRQNAYPMRPLRTSGFGALFRDAALRAGFHPFPLPAAILTEPRDGRQACTYCSFCSRFACHVNAKGSALTTVLPEALATGRLSVRTGCRVLSVAVNDRGEAIGVEYQTGDERVFQPAGVVILGSYVFENVRLLLLSSSPAFPNGVANNAGQVGRYYMTRQQPSVFGTFAGRKLNRFTGPVAQAQAVDDLNADHFDHTGLGFIRGGRIAAFNQFPPIEGSGRVPPTVRRWGRSYKDFLSASYNSLAMLFLDAEPLAYDANFLDLDPDVRDPLGVPVARITFDIYDNERRLFGFLQDRAADLMRSMGATDLWRNPFLTGAISTHDVGGTRMGVDPSRSVVDGFGQAHEVPGLVILGGSTFPTLPGLNPTLTMQALALRTAVRISGRTFEEVLG